MRRIRSSATAMKSSYALWRLAFRRGAVPLRAELAAAADIGEDVHAPLLQPGGPDRGIVHRPPRELETAVAGEQRRIAAVEGQVGAGDLEIGDAGAVLRDGLVLGDGQALRVEERREPLERLGRTAAGGAHRQGRRGQEAGGGEEIVVRVIGVDRMGARIDEIGQARHRLAVPSAIAVRQDLDPAPDVVQLVEEDEVPRRADARQRLPLGRLEQDVERRDPP